MTRHPVASSMIQEVGYEKETEELEVRFYKGGTYRYLGVPEREYEAFVDAESVGRYFRDNIRDQYSHQRIS